MTGFVERHMQGMIGATDYFIDAFYEKPDIRTILVADRLARTSIQMLKEIRNENKKSGKPTVSHYYTSEK